MTVLQGPKVLAPEFPLWDICKTKCCGILHGSLNHAVELHSDYHG